MIDKGPIRHITQGFSKLSHVPEQFAVIAPENTFLRHRSQELPGCDLREPGCAGRIGSFGNGFGFFGHGNMHLLREFRQKAIFLLSNSC
jgi:hypothetical protein